MDTQVSAKASARDWIAVLSTMLGAFMAVLDIQITNASLGDIEGALGAAPSEGSWISTAYLSAEIVTIPLTAWLGRVLGLKRYLVWNAALFVLFSVLCASATSLGEMIAFRAGQGFTGGVLIPTALTVLRRRLPAGQQTIGIAIFGFSATFAPTLGPTLGGWLTANYSWHYLFYINVVPGLLALALFLWALDPEPSDWRTLRDGDWVGVVLMAVGFSSLTVVLEDGQRWGWLDSDTVRVLGILAVTGICGFVARGLTAARPLVNLRVLANRSVGGGCVIMTVLGGVSLGSTYVIPLYCGEIQGYSPMQIGLVVMWAGLPQLLVFPMMPWLLRRFDPRLLILAGTLLFAASCYINTHLTVDVGMAQMILPQIMRGIGQPLFGGPLNQIISRNTAARDMPDASALSSMMRNLGGSLFIAMISTVVDRREQFHFSVLAEHMTRNGLLLQERLGPLASLPSDRRAIAALAAEVRRQATVMAFSDAFALIGASMVVCLVMLPILRRTPQPAS